MPIPTPKPNESQTAFVSRCISSVANTDPDKPHDQVVAICHNAWRESTRSEGKDIDVVSRLANLRDRLVQVFGDLGQRYYDYTLARLGVINLGGGKFDLSVFKSADYPVPYAKSHKDGSIEFCNMPLFGGTFTKVAEDWSVVAAYANTAVVDCDMDLVFPSDYRQSAEAYMKFPAKIRFMHHRGMDAGDILKKFKDAKGKIWKSGIDDIGWYVVSKPYDFAKSLIKKGTLRAYSIGGRFMMARRAGGLWVYRENSVQISDLSYVTNPCNKLCFFDLVKSSSLSDDPVNSSSAGGAINKGQQNKKKENKKTNKYGGKRMKADEEKLRKEDNPEDDPENDPEDDPEDDPEKCTPKSALEVYKGEIAKATTQDEMDKAKEKYFEARALEKTRAKELARIEKDILAKHENELSKLPEKMEKMEESLQVLTDLVGDIKSKTDARFEKIEEAPALKVSSGNIEDNALFLEKKIRETGDIDAVARDLEKARKLIGD